MFFPYTVENSIITHLPVRLYYQAKNGYPILNETQLSLSGKFKDEEKTKSKSTEKQVLNDCIKSKLQ